MLNHQALAAAASVVLVLCGWVPRTAHAEEDPNYVSVSLREAVQQALAKNADLQGSRFALRAAEADVLTAGLRPAPKLGLQVEDAFGTGSAKGTDRAQWTLSLSQVVELGGRAKARVGAAESYAALAQVDQDARQLDVLANVARQYVELLTAQARHALAQETLNLARQTYAEIRDRVRAARSPEFHERRAAIAVARAELALEHAEHGWELSSRQLAATWGAADATHLRADGQLMLTPQVDAFEALLHRLHEQPAWQRFATESRLRDAEWRMARASRRPDVEWMVGARQLPGGDDQALVAGVSVPLFGKQRAQGAIDSAQWRREQTAAEAEQAKVQMSARLFAFYQSLRHAVRELDALQNTILPQLEAVERQTRDGLRRGRFAYFEWADAQRDLLASRRARIDAAREAHLNAIELERLTGVALSAEFAVRTTQEPNS